MVALLTGTVKAVTLKAGETGTREAPWEVGTVTEVPVTWVPITLIHV